MSRKSWAAVLALGVVMIPVGAVWMAYAIMRTEPNPSGSVTSDSVWPVVAFFVAFIGGILVTVGSLGFFFRWMTGDDDDNDNEPRTSPSETLAHAVPKTRIGWGGDDSVSRPR
jgi:hypothetical protein